MLFCRHQFTGFIQQYAIIFSPYLKTCLMDEEHLQQNLEQYKEQVSFHRLKEAAYLQG